MHQCISACYLKLVMFHIADFALFLKASLSFMVREFIQPLAV